MQPGEDATETFPEVTIHCRTSLVMQHSTNLRKWCTVAIDETRMNRQHEKEEYECRGTDETSSSVTGVQRKRSSSAEPGRRDPEFRLRVPVLVVSTVVNFHLPSTSSPQLHKIKWII